ncbi:MAG: three-Cys-motif partner protein TcmP [Candidatus Rokubacteria bacterium]|nr:three-Cys-motif partner protein TcmP [Candidatus Rokubacteria bacterium]
MKPADYYRGREQTYLKHFFLERYLERVTYNIGSFAKDFVYVDGFSGPWKSDETLQDTSFMIAIEKLREVRAGLATGGKTPRIRCLFIESDAAAFRALDKVVQSVTDIEIRAIHGQFEAAIPEFLRFVGTAFALVFIDPTGWSGFGLKRIAAILQHRPGEVLVNFMFDHINRFLEDSRPEISASFTELFGGPGWEIATKATARREDSIVEFYRERMRTAGSFAHVTSTRILKPTADRAYFYLIYGTRHPKGLREFRAVEKQAVEEQERVRLAAKQDNRVERSGQNELFAAAVASSGPSPFTEERARQRHSARTRLHSLLLSRSIILYEDALTSLLEMPLVWESDVKQLIAELRDSGELEVRGLKMRERTPKEGHFLVHRKA